MPDILHRISIDAPREDVHELVTTTAGIARWWSGRPVEGDSAVGSKWASTSVPLTSQPRSCRRSPTRRRRSSGG